MEILMTRLPGHGKTMLRGLIAAVLVLSTAFAQPAELEDQVKASYLYNFVRFVSWPQDVFGGDGKFQLCVVGAERFGTALVPIAGERVEGREIVIRRLDPGIPASAIRCHLLFVAAGNDTSDVGIERGTL